jgi:hypothetical protein
LEERRLGLAELVARYWRRGGWAWLNWWLDIGGEEAGLGLTCGWRLDIGGEEAGLG